MALPDDLTSDNNLEETHSHGDSRLGEHQAPSVLKGASVSIPDDLMDMDVSLRDDEEPPGFSSSDILPSPDRVVEPRPRPYGRVALVITVIAAVLTWSAGYLQRSDLLPRSSPATPLPPPSTILVDLHDDLVLMLERSGDLSRVIVEKSGQANWLLLSKDDTTATNPALSSDGEQVAYVTKRSSGQLVIVSLSTDARRRITRDQMRKAGKDAGFDEMKLCPWTPIAWAPPAGDRIAFFGCVEDSSVSVAIVCDLSDPANNLKIVASSKAEASNARQLKWLDHTRLVVSTPGTDAKQTVVTTFVVP